MADTYLSARPTVPWYDARGGSYHNPDNWIEVVPGRFALSGSGEANNYNPSAAVVSPEQAMAANAAAGAAHQLDPNTIYSNPQMALQWANQNPGAFDPHFLSNIGILGAAQQQGYAGPALQPFQQQVAAFKASGQQYAPTTLLSAEEKARRALLSRLAG
jgi:hypothetical protein